MFRQNRGREIVIFVFPLFLLSSPYSSPFLTTKEISILSYNTNSNLPSFLTYLTIPFYVCFIYNIIYNLLKMIGSKMNIQF